MTTPLTDQLDLLIAALRRETPALLRWAGAIARRLRTFNISLEGKASGSAETDALTLADLTLQELLVGALRDVDPLFRRCRIEAEEETGDLAAFTPDSPFTLALDPIDGTKQFRDRTGDGYAVMLHLRDRDAVLYSLVFTPEQGPHGTWMQAYEGVVKCGPDDPRRPATDVLDDLPPIDPGTRPDARDIYVIGFQKHDAHRARDVTDAGLIGHAPGDMPGSIYPLLATGQFGGSLIHSPNIYDFPVSQQIARSFGGDSLWVHNRQPAHFGETWLDDRADMLRLPGIVATATNRNTLQTLVNLARDWSPIRYTD